MAGNCCLRCILTVLHSLIGLGAGFFCLFSLIVWDFQNAACLPTMIDQLGNQVHSSNGLLVVCDSIVYGMAVICLSNFVACILINWQWQSPCIAFFNLLLTVVYIAVAVMGGTAITLYYIVWCDSLQRKFVNAPGCEDAAHSYDSYNSTGHMGMYKLRMEIQMGTLWGLFPLIGFSTLVYSLTMRIFAKPDARDGQFRYLILHDEATPLLHHDNNAVHNESAYTNSANIHEASTHQMRPNMASGSTNPFDN